jgi:hypothetical protein
VHHTEALTFDSAATQAWLHRRSGLPGFTVAEALGIDDELTGRGLEGFLPTVDNVLTAEPAGLDRRDDILAAVNAGDSGLSDGINRMVNATIVCLRGDADDLRTVVENSYSEGISTILDWIREAAS